MTKDTARNVLGGFIAGSFGASLAALYIFPVPAANHDIIMFLMGQLAGFMGAVIGFNYGTTKGSAEKTRLLADRPLDLTGMEAKE